MKTYCTVHAVVQRQDEKILLLQRASHRTSPDKWNCVTGFIQERESAEEAALREVKEETNLDGMLIKSAEPHWKEENDIRKIYIPSLIHVENINSLIIDQTESQNFKWVNLTDSLISDKASLKKSLKLLGLIK